MHSHIDPFPVDHKRYPGLGGMARRAKMIKDIRLESDNVLLLDAGDIFQGTPYFNFYGGQLELELMSKMGYDGATMGNHDFDNGLEGFKKVRSFANFPFICSNYNFTGTILENDTIPFKIYHKKKIKIGVFGLGIELEGLVNPAYYKGTKYLDPIETCAEYTRILKQEHGCHLVICLSHLGYKYDDGRISDVELAKKTCGIDLIIGGHTHTFLDQAEQHTNIDGKHVLINQVGWAGIRLGQVEFYFDKRTGEKIELNATKSNNINCANY